MSLQVHQVSQSASPAVRLAAVYVVDLLSDGDGGLVGVWFKFGAGSQRAFGMDENGSEYMQLLAFK
jgi:hypothetical protein